MHFSAYHIPLLLGIIFLIYGLYRLKRYTSMRKWGLRAEGCVYDVIDKMKSTEDANYTGTYMIMGFLTREQKLIIKEMNVTINPYRYKKDDAISVLYEKNNPEHCVIDDGNSPAYTYFLCLFPGILFVLVGIWMICMRDTNVYG